MADPKKLSRAEAEKIRKRISAFEKKIRKLVAERENAEPPPLGFHNPDDPLGPGDPDRAEAEMKAAIDRSVEAMIRATEAEAALQEKDNKKNRERVERAKAALKKAREKEKAAVEAFKKADHARRIRLRQMQTAMEFMRRMLGLDKEIEAVRREYEKYLRELLKQGVQL